MVAEGGVDYEPDLRRPPGRGGFIEGKARVGSVAFDLGLSRFVGTAAV